MDEQNVDEILKILEKPTYTEIILCIVAGKNYATSIARFLEKKQPTVTEQLLKLEKLGLIRPKKRGKAKEYEVNWDVLLEIFYDIVDEVIEGRKEFLKRIKYNEIKRKGINKIIPPELIKIFLREYILAFIELGGKRKGFDEIIFSFFSALNNLEESYWKNLIKKFKLNGNLLSEIARLMEFEISGIEQTAIMTYLDIEGDNLGKKES